MQCHTQAKIITINLTVELYFTLPELSETNVVTCDCHVYDSAKGRYDIILGRYLLTTLLLNLKLSDHVIEANDVPLKGSSTPMDYLGMYEFKYLNTNNITPEESFTNSYAAEIN